MAIGLVKTFLPASLALALASGAALSQSVSGSGSISGAATGSDVSGPGGLRSPLGAPGPRPVYPVDSRNLDLLPRSPVIIIGEPEILSNPLDRNPARRAARGPDLAPPADIRNSTERPTERAAPGPDARDTVVVPDPSRDTVPVQPGAIR